MMLGAATGGKMITELHADGTLTVRCTVCGKLAKDHIKRAITRIADGEIISGIELLCEDQADICEDDAPEYIN